MKTRKSKKSQAPRSSADSTASRPRHKRDLSLATVKSAISNGRIFGSEVDRTQPWYRRFRDILHQHFNDLGGEDVLSEAQKALCRRAACLQLQCEMQEHRWAQNDGEASPRQLLRYQTVSNTLRRLVESLGLNDGPKREPQDITPPLDHTRGIIDHLRGLGQ